MGHFIKTSDIPDSIRNDVIGVDNTSKKISNQNLDYLVRRYIADKVNILQKKIATQNPIEFVRYHKLISDYDFCILFSNICVDPDEKRKLIDALEILILCSNNVN